MNLSAELVNFAYIISAALFILGLKMLGHPDSARRGNLYSAVGMALAIIVTLLADSIVSFEVMPWRPWAARWSVRSRRASSP